MRRVLLAVSASLLVTACTGSTDQAVKNATLPATPRAEYYIAGMGDSFGSGEGNPARHGSGEWEETSWFSTERPQASEICHRSSESGFYKAVRRLESRYPNIEFVRKNFACSGAIVENILWIKQVPENAQFHETGLRSVNDTQMNMLSSWKTENTAFGQLDAVYLSIGGNNARFADALKACILLPSSVTSTRGLTCTDLEAVREGSAVATNQTSPAPADRTLYELYNSLDTRLDSLSPSQVVISTYPNFAKRSDGSWCAVTGISAAEFEGLWRAIGVPLNDRINERADALGWDVATMENRFVGHGICEDDRWINTRADAVDRQGRDMDNGGGPLSTGMFHPNNAGYEAYADAIEAKLNAGLKDRLTPDRAPTMRVTKTSIEPTHNTIPGVRVAGAPWWMIELTPPPLGRGVDSISSVFVTVKLADGSTSARGHVPVSQRTVFVRATPGATITATACGYQWGRTTSDVFCGSAAASYRTPLLTSSTVVAP